MELGKNRLNIGRTGEKKLGNHLTKRVLWYRNAPGEGHYQYNTVQYGNWELLVMVTNPGNTSEKW